MRLKPVLFFRAVLIIELAVLDRGGWVKVYPSAATHDQNVRRLCVKVVNPDDQAAVANVELMVRERLEKMGKEGEFYPAEKADTHR